MPKSIKIPLERVLGGTVSSSPQERRSSAGKSRGSQQSRDSGNQYYQGNNTTINLITQATNIINMREKTSKSRSNSRSKRERISVDSQSKRNSVHVQPSGIRE